jgi:hypothetical protein
MVVDGDRPSGKLIGIQQINMKRNDNMVVLNIGAVKERGLD